jgi:MYXO-CTERM domain-containing protein
VAVLGEVLVLLLTVPFAPSLDAPGPDAWVVRNGYFATGAYADDAGVPAAFSRLEFRPADGGYGAYDETLPWTTWRYTAVVLPNEGAHWCWRARYVNTRGEAGDPSVERCFRTDWSAPSAPGVFDAGSISSTGRVVLDFAPATDVPSGVKGYALMPGSAADGPFYWYVDDSSVLPLVTYFGEGAWFGSVRVKDQADNQNPVDPSTSVPLFITANPAVLTPALPRFESLITRGYGDSIVWDDSSFLDAGVTHVVASYCNFDGGCTSWRHGLTGSRLDRGNRAWLQVGDEGTMVSRIAVVVGDEVGPWSAPSAPVLVDRQAPPIPPNLTTPLATRAQSHTINWGLVVDGFTGTSSTVIEQLELSSAARQVLDAPTPETSLVVTAPSDGQYQYRVASRDRAGNQSGWSSPAVVTIDSTGPTSMAPIASAQAADGGAWVTLTWADPVDALSAVTGLEVDEASTIVAVSGSSTQRFVPPGRWTWALRGTDALGNVGEWSAPSNEVIVTESGVMVMPPPDAVNGARSFAVGCGCSTDQHWAPVLGWLALALLRRTWWRRSQTQLPFSPSGVEEPSRHLCAQAELRSR